MLITLFDIDGTLVRINATGRKVMGLALKEVFGTAGSIDSISFAGKTDRSIIRDAMLASGISPIEIERGLEATFEAMIEIGQKLFFEDGLIPCNGALKLLEIISRRNDMMLGLLTGNASGTAALKLHAAGIDPSVFRFGAYGSDSADRNELVPIALERARESASPVGVGKSAIVIGDTPADIACAQSVGAPVLAVATGTCSMNELSKYKPDYLLPDLGNTELVVKILVSISKGADEQTD